ncbi:uncharacterized protein M6B38_168040 [Iris pallida]|uniref:Uncharacterized protein n=1 Tax=Iris pallida TaxID=29817 RepID=A0AAX6EWR3_IRIPA|nr:uncharacterized protein M6B38_168040 [Iris pallida]
MAWWRQPAFSARRAWIGFSARVKARKNGGGILELYNDVQSCGYQDVQVMWEMLRRSETSSTNRKRPIWRLPLWSNS